MMIEEPPSPLGRIKLFLRRLSVIQNSLQRRLPKLIPVLVALFLAVAFGTDTYAAWRIRVEPQSTSDSERVAFALSNYIDLDTLKPADTQGDFSTIAFAGQNVGGLPSDEASLAQYVVSDGDTLSTIAAKYNLHSASIALANKDLLSNTDMIHPGQVLFIPAQDASNDQIQQLNTQKQAAVASTKKTKKTIILSNVDNSGLHLGQPLAYYTYKSQPFNAITHPGIDFATSPGTPVKAVKDGCIVLADTGWNGGYGTTIIFNIGGGYAVRYAHLSAFAGGVSPGACFSAGDIIAYSGDTGRSTGPHLHFEVRLNGVPHDPANYGL